LTERLNIEGNIRIKPQVSYTKDGRDVRSAVSPKPVCKEPKDAFEHVSVKWDFEAPYQSSRLMGDSIIMRDRLSVFSQLGIGEPVREYKPPMSALVNTLPV
jgi:hypothetical protein